MKVLLCLTIAAVIAATSVSLAYGDNPQEVTTLKATYQGKDIEWWASRAVQARRDANARAVTIRRLRRIISYSPTIEEAVALASVTYPEMRPCDAWGIIRHESWMTSDPAHAKNPSSSAAGLYQFLSSTWMSTPYGKAGFSVFSPYASSLAAGWMHSVGRRGEWAISRC